MVESSKDCSGAGLASELYTQTGKADKVFSVCLGVLLQKGCHPEVNQKVKVCDQVRDKLLAATRKRS